MFGDDQALGRGLKRIDLDFKPKLPFSASSALSEVTLYMGWEEARERGKGTITGGYF